MKSLPRTIAKRVLGAAEERWHSRFQQRYDLDLNFTEAVTHFPDRNALYAYMHHCFYHHCPETLRQHRVFFKQEQRGFGENALHAMWWLLLRQFRPINCLEIGVYRGQVISLWSLIARSLSYTCDVHGISPFTSVGDHVSMYTPDVNYLQDTLKFFNCFNLPVPMLVQGLSNEPSAVEYISSQRWDLIYIDGSHDYDVVLADYCLCRDHLNPGGLLVLDDSSLGTSYHPTLYSFVGHPGPSRVCREVAMGDLLFLGGVGHNNVFMKASV
jgi:hypothetical protein